MADDMMKMNAMGERPPMPDMSGANMKRENPMNAMPAKGREHLMKSSQEIAAVLMARLANMSPEELRMLDSAITPAVARVLMRLLPELRELIGAVNAQNAKMKPQQAMPKQMGALGNM